MLTEFFVLTGLGPNQTTNPKRKISVSFGDTNVALPLIDWIDNLLVDFARFSASKFSGKISSSSQFQGRAPLDFIGQKVHFDSTQLIQTPGTDYEVTLEIEHPNLPWKIKEDITISAQLDQEPICFAPDSNNPVNFAGIYPNPAWLQITNEMEIILQELGTNNDQTHATWPRSFGTGPLSYNIDFTNYTELKPLPFERDLLILKAEIGGLEREYPYSESFLWPEYGLPTTFDIFELENNDQMWNDLMSGVAANPLIGDTVAGDKIRKRIEKYKEALQAIWNTPPNNKCGNCIHCRIYEELEKQGRPRTITRWIFTAPDKIPNSLRPMIATVLMIPDHVWTEEKWSPSYMPYYSWWHGDFYVDRINGTREHSMARGGIFFKNRPGEIIPVRDDLPITQTCAGYTSGTPIRMKFRVEGKGIAIVNWIGGLQV